MGNLQISDLDFSEVVTEEDIQITGGLKFADLLNFFPQLQGYEVTEVSSDNNSVVKKISKPGVVGYEVSTDDGKSKSRSVTLVTNNPQAKTVASFIINLSST
ncbi:hypothetical protein HW132_00210 [Brasilonema sp. CT11]|nr:hypothetical protein [Brasilonema sp. CT11]